MVESLIPKQLTIFTEDAQIYLLILKKVGLLKIVNSVLWFKKKFKIISFWLSFYSLEQMQDVSAWMEMYSISQGCEKIIT